MLACSGLAHAAEVVAPAPVPVDDRARALECMALAIAYESGFEPRAGQMAVGEVILNRTRHPTYPKSVCGVVFQGSHRRTGCQFTFTCDGALRRPLPRRVIDGARQVAAEVLAGSTSGLVGGATHYHANYVSPYWAPTLLKVGVVGQHIFYRNPGTRIAAVPYAGGAEPGGLLPPGIPAPAEPAQVATVQASPRTRFAPWGLAVGSR